MFRGPPWGLRARTRRERGGSLAEYALMTALFSTVVAGAFTFLEDRSAVYLTDTGSAISKPRGLQQEIGINPDETLPPWLTTPPAPSITTTSIAGAPVDGGVLIAAGHSGLCLGTRGGQTGDWTVVEQQTCNGEAHQRWLIEAGGTVGSTIRNQKSGSCMDLPPRGGGGDGVVRIVACNGTSAQELWLSDHPAGGTRLTGVESGRCVTIRSELMVPGAEARRRRCRGGPNQAFTIDATAP